MISKFIFTTILGWKLVGNYPKDLKKFILIGAPHTSWKDFPIAILARNVWGIKINFIGKKSLFKPPFGFIFKSLGGTPIDRSKSTNKVDSIISLFNENEQFRLALSPEGTRKKVNEWKTGFYYIAKGAKVPIIMLAFDFGNKQIKLAEPYYTTDDKKKDFNTFYDFYRGIKGAIPELSEAPDRII
ncbi:1-acyl-sn-glycerol-3-phosphate acyltransferase [Tenacibaculum insulae]|uniref:1-acyl-sn-glycerol-3-phosphate acyltransferase n=1 Tax=Tenacibaculum insulae TaxID=2029677 RepID=UPI003AB84BC6